MPDGLLNTALVAVWLPKYIALSQSSNAERGVAHAPNHFSCISSPNGGLEAFGKACAVHETIAMTDGASWAS